MRFLICALLTVFLCACAAAPSHHDIDGGTRIYESGLSFVLPKGKSWSAIVQSKYITKFGADDMPKDESLIVNTTVYNITSVSSKQAFLELIKKGRHYRQTLGNFEIIRNSEELYDGRAETCVIHQAALKDFGEAEKSKGKYTILETYGLNCIHPYKPAVAINIELSWEAPPGAKFPGFNTMATDLLQSASFSEF